VKDRRVNEADVKRQLERYCKTVWERGWVANHDGNLSARLPRARVMCTPTALSKADITADMMLVLDDTGKVQQGSRKPFSEINLHLAWYHARPDVGAVLHAHPPCATALGVCGQSLDRPFLPEAVVSLGPIIPTVPLAMPGLEAVQAAGPYLDEYDALILSGNGVITCGPDLELAYLRMELVEHLARIYIEARKLGGPDALPPRYLQPLLAARAKAGLGPEARGGNTTMPAEEPLDAAAGDLASIVRAEIKKTLG